MAVFLFLVVLSGCESLLTHEGAPNIRSIVFGTTCGGSEIATVEWYVGNTVNVGIDFLTNNVDQDFEAAVLIDSDTVPDVYLPSMPNVITFTTLDKELISAKGLKRATFSTMPGCFSEGMYRLTVIITDATGDSDSETIEFAVKPTDILGSHPCKCITQCGECSFPLFYTKVERCQCNCQLKSEKCD